MIEDTGVEERGRVSTRGLGLFTRAHANALHEVISFCQAQGAVVGVQLAHAGRKAKRDVLGRGASSIAPTDAAFDIGWQAPQKISGDGLGPVVESFVSSARLAVDAGADVLEIHAAHGYLLHEFLSPVTNSRDGATSDLEYRAAPLVRVCSAVRDALPGTALLVRLPASDCVEGGLKINDVVEVAERLVGCDVDAIDVGGSGITPEAPPPDADTQHSCAQRIKEKVGLRVIAGGGIGTARDGQASLEKGICDVVALGRPLLADPYWPAHAARELGAESLYPPQYPL